MGKQILADIKSALKEVHSGHHDNNSQTAWTKAFKNALSNLGKEKKYKIYPNNKKKEGEWLVDLCWAIEGKNWRIDFEGLKLACEIEWSNKIDDIIYDFQKLTVINADIRLMIFQYNDDDKYNKIINAIKLASKFTKHKYLIAASGNKEKHIKICTIKH